MASKIKRQRNREKVAKMLKRGECSLRCVAMFPDKRPVSERNYRWEAFNSDGKTWDLGSHPFPRMARG